MSSIYNGQFMGKILIVGRTNCGKTMFIEKSGLNNFFGNIVKTERVSGIAIDKKKKLKFNLISKTRLKFMLRKIRINLILYNTFKQRSHENYDNSNVNSSFVKKEKWVGLLLWTVFLV